MTTKGRKDERRLQPGRRAQAHVCSTADEGPGDVGPVISDGFEECSSAVSGLSINLGVLVQEELDDFALPLASRCL